MLKPSVDRLIEFGAAFASAPGEIDCGDAHLFHENRLGALFGVVDGAGHGSEAASAARAAIDLLKLHAEEPLDAVLDFCHEGLRKTRGAAVSLAAWDAAASRIAWAGVGNVEGLILRRREGTRIQTEALLLRNGVVGYQFVAPRVWTLPVHAGDLLIFVTDGIAPEFLEEIDWDGPVQAAADSILARHAKGSDDALALVVRFRTGAS
jgi:phosphoserine phosphatase RsbX